LVTCSRSQRKSKKLGSNFTCQRAEPTPRLWIGYRRHGFFSNTAGGYIVALGHAHHVQMLQLYTHVFSYVDMCKHCKQPYQVVGMQNVPRYRVWGSCKEQKPLMQISNMCFSRLTQPFAFPYRLRPSTGQQDLLSSFLAHLPLSMSALVRS
jgi:hypothetical protein